MKSLQKEHAKSLKEDNKCKIIKLKKEIDEMNTQEIQKKLLFTKQQYYETGGKSLKLLSFNSFQFSFIYIAPNYNNCHLKAL